MLINEITSGYVIGMILAAENAIKAFMELIGPEDPADAKEQAPCSIRALYGQTKLKNAIYGSTTYDELVRVIATLKLILQYTFSIIVN